ncbi:Hypothetical protein R9X50_00046100 [Acrodontium crateriforme]|uniref:Uncharacterized protein n=1 Tax=Acrodontium crateriforme TaxID=150365 RepID=A0AAQ3LY41_9PEZI|nr:Hypothetical protein R9X50_00046100 [Acrodontium crateriforme]
MSGSATVSSTSRRQSLNPEEQGVKEDTPRVPGEAAGDVGAPPVADYDGGEDAVPQGAWQPGANAFPAAATGPVDEDIFSSGTLQPYQTMANDDGNSAYREVAPDELLPPTDFNPSGFFMLIEDTETGEFHHPTMHYIFSDDDPELFTSAALEAIERSEEAGAHGAAAKTSQSTHASSLSPNWQMVKTTIRSAPSMNEADAGLMLQISGLEATRAVPVNTKRMVSSNLDDLVKTFGDRLCGLDELLGRDESNDNDGSHDPAGDKNVDT